MRMRRSRRIRCFSHILTLLIFIAYVCWHEEWRTIIKESKEDNETTVRSIADKEWEILELSSWHNFSSQYATVYDARDASIIESSDRKGEFYVVGGYLAHYGDTWKKIQKIDANDADNRWILLENVTIPSYLATTHAGLFLHDHRLYVITGQVDYGCGPATRAAAYLNMSTGSWVRLPDVPEPRYAPATIVSDHRVHLFAGAKADRTTPAHDYWILDLKDLDRGWTRGPALPHSGDHGRASLINEWIYFYSFEHGHAPLDITHTGVWERKKRIVCPGSYIAQPQVMKIHSKPTGASQWIRVSDMPRPAHHATSLVLNNRWIMVLGGISHREDDQARTVQLFDTVTQRWRLLAPLTDYSKSPLVWMDRDQSTLYLQTERLFRRGQTQHAHPIWSQAPQTRRCLFFTGLNCTTRKLARSPFSPYRRASEMRWHHLFSHIYLMNMPVAADRLRHVWPELRQIDLTSITLLETFQVQDLAGGPLLIDEEVVWPDRIRAWRKKNDTRSILHLIRSQTSIKLMFMNLWTRNTEHERSIKPILIFEDDVHFLLPKEQTFRILYQTFDFLQTRPGLEWDLVYLAYRNVEATRLLEISPADRIYLWRASKVLSNTAFIVNPRAETMAKLNRCFVDLLGAADQAISSCLKHKRLRAFLIEPKLAQAKAGFSFNTNRFEDYAEENVHLHSLGKHTPPAKFH